MKRAEEDEVGRERNQTFAAPLAPSAGFAWNDVFSGGGERRSGERSENLDC